MSKGTVKWFNDAKGFGFITPEDEIQIDGYKSLKGGHAVGVRSNAGPEGPGGFEDSRGLIVSAE